MCSEVALPIQVSSEAVAFVTYNAILINPLWQTAIGDGGLYTILSGILVISCLGFLLVIRKGKEWRDPNWRLMNRSRVQGPSDATADR